MALGLDGEEILDFFYNKVTFQLDGEDWRMPFSGERLKGTKPLEDVIDAETGKVVIAAGKKLQPALPSSWMKRALSSLKFRLKLFMAVIWLKTSST